MNEYEELLDHAEKENINVIEDYDLSDTRLKGLYCDGVVALDKNIETESERRCVLAEELGHYHTTVGDILDPSSSSNRKQELHARVWAYNKLIGLNGIVDAYKHGCLSSHEVAEYLNVTEAFLQETLSCYRSKYGKYTKFGNYVIYFQPNISVLELIEAIPSKAN